MFIYHKCIPNDDSLYHLLHLKTGFHFEKQKRPSPPPPLFSQGQERYSRATHKAVSPNDVVKDFIPFFPDNYFITLYYSALQLFYCLFVFLLSPVYIQIFVLMQTNDSLNTEQQKGIIYLIKYVFFSVFILLSLFSKPPPFLWVMNVLVCFVIPSTSPQFAA